MLAYGAALDMRTNSPFHKLRGILDLSQVRAWSSETASGKGGEERHFEEDDTHGEGFRDAD